MPAVSAILWGKIWEVFVILILHDFLSKILIIRTFS